MERQESSKRKKVKNLLNKQRLGIRLYFTCDIDTM
jgi:hypothetical protein